MGSRIKSELELWLANKSFIVFSGKIDGFLSFEWVLCKSSVLHAPLRADEGFYKPNYSLNKYLNNTQSLFM